MCELPLPRDIQEVDSGDVEKLISTLKEDSKVRAVMTNYHRLEAYYYSYGISSDNFKDKIESALSNAGSYKEKIEPITTTKEAGLLSENIKKIHKNLRKDIRQLNSERLEREKLQVIEPIEIGQSHAIFTISLFTTLFLVSGFVYIKFVYGNLGLRVGDFFNAGDYISSSVDVLAPALISTALGLAGMLYGLNSVINQDLLEDQFENSSKKSDYANLLFVLMLTIGLVVHSYKTGEISSFFLLPLLTIIGIFVFFRLPIWKYIKNRTPVSAVLLSIFYFSLHLGLTIKDDIGDIKSESFESPYIVTFKSSYEAYQKYDFIGGNSNFVFLYDQKGMHVIAIPRLAVKAIRSK